ncbi:MAG: hypothetical protein OHK0052_27700 [Anaerolineales bacterium]
MSGYNRGVQKIFSSLLHRLYPEAKQLPDEQRAGALGNLLTVVYLLPLSVIGLTWQITSTRLDILRAHWLPLLLFGALLILFNRLRFFTIVEIKDGRLANSDESLDQIVQWTAIFLFGATAAWLSALWQSTLFAYEWRRSRGSAVRWFRLRQYLTVLTAVTLNKLLALQVYAAFGGTLPFDGFTPQNTLAALIAIFTDAVLAVILLSGYLMYVISRQRLLTQASSARSTWRFLWLALGLPNLATPFAVLGAGLYAEHGQWLYVFFSGGLLLVALLARQLSRAAEGNRQRARQLDKLEQLGEAIIKAPLDASALPQILQENIPPMFPSAKVLIWVLPQQILLRSPADFATSPADLWGWVREQRSVTAFAEKDPLPWAANTQQPHMPLVIAPILDVEGRQVVGGIYVELQNIVRLWDKHTLRDLFPVVNALTSQIASTLRQAEVYLKTLELQKVSQELTLAGRIQASFLPNKMPNLPGWQLAVTLLPARATSGDFFDFIPLPDGRLGILIADVADKGIGPALFMALSRTLLRTYATEYPWQPEVVLQATNRRVLNDTRASLFVTVFYGVLDPKAGTLIYSNAGHNPPYLLRAPNGSTSNEEDIETLSLGKTGIPVGIDEDTRWEQRVIHIEPGDVLILYTDGITEAQDPTGNFFDDDLLVEAAESRMGQPAFEIQSAILDSVQTFVGEHPQSDDITLMVLARDKLNGTTPVKDTPVNFE